MRKTITLLATLMLGLWVNLIFAKEKANASSKQTDGYRKHSQYDNFHLEGKIGAIIDKDSKLTFSAGYHKANRGAYPWTLTEAKISKDRRQANPGTENDEGVAEKVNMNIIYKQPYLSIAGYLRKEEGNSFGTLVKPTKEYIDDEKTYGINIQSEFSHTINSFAMVIVMGLLNITLLQAEHIKPGLNLRFKGVKL